MISKDKIKARWFLIVIFIVALIFTFKVFFAPNLNYKKALKLAEAGQYAEAFEIFDSLGDYKDSLKQAETIKIFHSADLLKLISTGNIVSFGTYEQDNNISNGPEDIEWLVLKRESNRILVVSRYILDCNLKDTQYDDVWMRNAYTWEQNRFRSWLNDIFLKTAFNSSERSSIPTVKVITEEDGKNSTGTHDKVFFLSTSEVNQYFIFDTDLECKPTEYAKARGCLPNEYHKTENCTWWLRSHARGSNDSFITINDNGSINEGGAWMTSNSIGIRPALWINLDS